MHLKCGALKLQVSFAEYRLFYRALLQKRRVTACHAFEVCSHRCAHTVCSHCDIHTNVHTHTHTRTHAHTHTHTHTGTHIYTHPRVFRFLRGSPSLSFHIFVSSHIQITPRSCCNRNCRLRVVLQ